MVPARLGPPRRVLPVDKTYYATEGGHKKGISLIKGKLADEGAGDGGHGPGLASGVRLDLARSVLTLACRQGVRV
jgi:hypothetical protein